MQPSELVSIIAERPDFYRLDPASKRQHIAVAVDLFEKVLSTLDADSRASIEAETQSRSEAKF